MGNLTVDELEATLKSLFPREAYVLVRDQIARIQSEPPVGLISVAVAVALWVVLSLSLTVIDALNRTFGVAETRSFVKVRLMALAMTLLQRTVLLGSLVAIVAGPQVLRALGLNPIGAVAWLATVARWIVVFVTVLMSFALTFNVGPAARQRWVWITPGTLAGTVAFLVFSYLFRVYVQYYSSYDTAYGSLGGIMVLLFWYWVVGMVLLGAAEMDRAIEAASPMSESNGQRIDRASPRSASDGSKNQGIAKRRQLPLHTEIMTVFGTGWSWRLGSAYLRGKSYEPNGVRHFAQIAHC